MSFLGSAWRSWAGAVGLTLALSAPVAAQTSVSAPGESTSGAYMDYMKTVYARAGFPEMIQLPLTSFDNEYELMAWPRSRGSSRRTG
jgi:hypothetical protein